jgi:malate dehydrogenase (oxaloacetate-decarboxylating)(NADP+)
MRRFVRKAAPDPRKIVFPEGDDPRILKAASIIVDERIGRPVLLGEAERIPSDDPQARHRPAAGQLDIVDPRADEKAAVRREAAPHARAQGRVRGAGRC